MIRRILIGIVGFMALQSSLYATVPTQENVTKLYVATFNRAPDAAGLEYWIVTPGLTLESIARYFFDQPETQKAYPPGSTTLDFVSAVYRNLFNRVPDQAGLDYWVEELDSGRVSKSTFILYVIGGAQNDDATILRNKTTVGQAYVSVNYNNTTWAKEVMAPVNASQGSVDKSITMIRSFTNTTCINNYYERTSPQTGMSLCMENVYQEFCEKIADPDDTWGVNAFMIPFTCIDAGYPAETFSPEYKAYYGNEQYLGASYAIQTGDITDTTYLDNTRQSLAETSGALVQAVLSINTFIFTNNATTSLDTFKARKKQVDQALAILETKASVTDGYLNQLASAEEAEAYIIANYSSITPDEVEAVLNSSKMKGVLRPLMAHYHVGARKAKEILDNAMDNLYTKYTKEADNYETATNIAKVVRDGSGLALTIGATIATAGTVTGLGVVGGITSVVQGADGLVKLSKSSAELIIGEDGALDDTYKHSALVSGLSAASEALAIKSLFTKPELAADAINNLFYMSSKTREFVQDEVIAFGPVSVKYGDYIHYKPNRKDYLRLLKNIYTGPIAFPSNGTYRSGTKVLVVDKEALKKLVEKPLKALPEDSRVQGTIDIIGGGDSPDPEKDDMRWSSWPNPQWCPKTLPLDSPIGILHVEGNDILCDYSLTNNLVGDEGDAYWTLLSEIPYIGTYIYHGQNYIDGLAKYWSLSSGRLYKVELYVNGELIKTETY